MITLKHANTPKNGEATKSVMNERRQAWEERYRSGPTPWDTGITPPEIVSFWAQGELPPTGLALDIGCGTATNTLYLANLGLNVIGMELSGLALDRAAARLHPYTERVKRRISLVQADVAQIPLRNAEAVYAMDVGCFHALPGQLRHDYTNGLSKNLRTGAFYQLYAFDRLPEDEDNPDARGLGPDEVEMRFGPTFEIVQIERAIPDPRPCRWYLLRRR
jgi:SAM-dependent methyltransferase